MKAAVRARYGRPEQVVELRDLEKPTPADDEVLVRVRAASVNIADWYGVVGKPRVGRFAMGLFGPKEARLGVDFSGVVEEVGRDVTDFQPDDEVFGGRTGAFSEYVVVKADRAVVRKPENVPFEVAAAVPVAAVTALQALRDKGRLESGQNVLVHGASGGVGTFAVQIARALGATVTAVCSTPNVEIARRLGAHRVIDYAAEDCTEGDEHYDLVVDIAGTRPLRHLRRVMKPEATIVVVGGPRKKGLLGPLGHVIGTMIAALFASQKAVFFIAKLGNADLETLRTLLESRELTSVIDSTYPLDQLSQALEHMGHGHPRGKIVISV